MESLPSLTIPRIDIVLKFIGFVVGACTFGFGAYQYWKAQTWKRLEFVAAEMGRFDSDPLVRNAMWMIDWGTRRIELFPSHPEYDSRFVLVNRPLLHAALVTHDKVGRAYTPIEAAIRDCFDSFFGGLERFEQFIQAGLIDATDVRPYLAYWVRSICEEANPELRRILNDYVAFYHFEGVVSLFQRYEKRFGTRDLTRTLNNRHEIQDRYEEQVRVAVASQDQPSNERVDTKA